MTAADTGGTVALADAIKGGEVAVVADRLADSPQLLWEPLDGVLSPLMLAVYYRQEPIVRDLIARGAPVDVFAAAALGDMDRLADILRTDPGAVEAVSPDGWTALHLAAHFGQREAAALLLSSGTSPHARSANGMKNTPLHAALAGDHEGVTELLIDAGADVNAAQAGGFTPIHAAAQNGNLRLVELLLARGADAQAVTGDGRTPAALAREGGHTEIADLLEGRGR